MAKLPRTITVERARTIRRIAGDVLTQWAGHYSTNIWIRSEDGRSGRYRRRVGRELPENNPDQLRILAVKMHQVELEAAQMRRWAVGRLEELAEEDAR